MADNVAITAGTGTDIATDDIGGVQHQRVKVTLGPDGTATADLAGRDVGSSNGAAFVDPRVSVVRLSVTPTISAASAYAAGDAIGGLLTFSNAARVSGASIRIEAAQLVDQDQERANIDLVLFDRTFTAPTDNAVFDPTDAELATCVGVIPIRSYDYADFNDNAVAHVPVALTAKLNGTDLFGALVSRGTPTYTGTSDLVVILTIAQD